MLPQNLQDYLKQAKDHNMPLSAVEAALQQLGWGESILVQVRAWWNQNTISPSPQTPSIASSTPGSGLQESEPRNQNLTETDSASHANDPVDNTAHPGEGMLLRGKVFDSTVPSSTKPFIYSNSPIKNQPINTGERNNKGIKTGGMSIGRKVIFGSVAAVFILLFIVSTSLTLVAYGQVNLGNRDMEATIADVVMSIPFTPKTPEYVLRKSTEAQKEVDRFYIDASFAASSSSFKDTFGVGKFDLAIKGPIDYTTPTNPTLALSVAFAKDFNLDLRLKDKITYFKVNQIPAYVKAYLQVFGFTDDLVAQFINKWFFYDAKALETEARQNLSEKEESLSQQTVDKINEVLYEEVIRKDVKMEDDMIDSVKVYKLHLAASKSVLNKIEDIVYEQRSENSDIPGSRPAMRASQYIHNFVINMWVDKEEYFVRKVSVSFVFKPPKTDAMLMPSNGNYYDFPSFSEEIPVALVMNFSKFGEDTKVEIPKDAVKFEDFMTQLLTIQSTGSGVFAQQFAQANNAKRASDVNAILNSIMQYQADKGKLPITIPSVARPLSKKGVDLCRFLVPTYIAALPVDPSINQGVSIQNCETSYDTGYTIQKVGTKITIAAPLAETGKEISKTR